MQINKLKIIFLGRKSGGAKALEHIAEKAQILFAITSEGQFGDPIRKSAGRLNIPLLASLEELCGLITSEGLKTKPALIISYLFSGKIKEPLLSIADYGAINFHPGPLPDYRGWASYNYAILNELKKWGASAHYMDKDYDAGPIIKTARFDIDPAHENCHSLETKTQAALFDLFVEVMDGFISGNTPEKIKNEGGRSWTKKEMELAKLIDAERDSTEEIDKKIRAYFFPPYSGATTLINGKSYTLINEEILKYLDKLLNYAG
jgi:methionyl-tRNA formyltransferase